MPRARFDLPPRKNACVWGLRVVLFSLMAFRKGGHSKGSGARSARDRLYNQSSRRMKLDSTRLRRSFFLESGYARPLVSLALRSPRQNRSIPWSPLSPAASTASMANMRASTALAPVTDSSSCPSPPFKGLPFAATILVRHFPGVSSNAVISRPLYCIARPLPLHRDAKVSKGLQLT